MVHEDMAKPLSDPGSRHDVLHLGGKLEATPALGGADDSLCATMAILDSYSVTPFAPILGNPVEEEVAAVVAIDVGCNGLAPRSAPLV